MDVGLIFGYVYKAAAHDLLHPAHLSLELQGTLGLFYFISVHGLRLCWYYRSAMKLIV
jgi:hypothetical protein